MLQAWCEGGFEMSVKMEMKRLPLSMICAVLVVVGGLGFVGCEKPPAPVPREPDGITASADPFDVGQAGKGAREHEDDFPPEPVVETRPGLSEAVAGAVTPERVATPDLGGAERYLTRVSTDKPMYRPGETVYVRGAILGAADNKPLAKNARANALVEIKGPKGDAVASGWVTSQESVLGFSWTVPEGQPGGEHVAKISYPAHGHAPAERKFDVRSYRAPRLKTQIVFLRDGYGPGDRAYRRSGGLPRPDSRRRPGRLHGLVRAPRDD